MKPSFINYLRAQNNLPPWSEEKIKEYSKKNPDVKEAIKKSFSLNDEEFKKAKQIYHKYKVTESTKKSGKPKIFLSHYLKKIDIYRKPILFTIILLGAGIIMYQYWYDIFPPGSSGKLVDTANKEQAADEKNRKNSLIRLEKSKWVNKPDNLPDSVYQRFLKEHAFLVPYMKPEVFAKKRNQLFMEVFLKQQYAENVKMNRKQREVWLKNFKWESDSIIINNQIEPESDWIKSYINEPEN